jgi:predicted ABC-type ATPase
VEEGVRNTVGEMFLELKNSAIQNKTDFAFETNYHHESVANTAKFFKEVGHETVLIFIALPSVEAAIQRVKFRVSQGGHSVDENTIHERYKKGLQLLYSTFYLFDRLHLFLSLENRVELILSLEPNQNVVNQKSIELMELLPKLETFIQSIKGKTQSES